MVYGNKSFGKGFTPVAQQEQNLTLLTIAGSMLFSRLRITAEVLLKKNKTC